MTAFSPPVNVDITITGAVAQTVVSVGLDNTTFVPDGINPKDVGNVVVVMSPASPAAAGAVVLGAADAGLFQLVPSSGILPCKVQARASTGVGNKTINLTFTPSDTAIAPLTSPNIIIAGSSALTLTTMVLQSSDGANIPAGAIISDFGLPIKPGDLLPTGEKIQILDSGSNVLGVAETPAIRSTDLSGAVRFTLPEFVLTNAPGAATTTVTIQKVSGAPNTSNPITVANVLAETSFSGFELLITVTMPNGTVYLGSCRDALQGINGGVNRGVFRQNSICTEFVLTVPMRTGGVSHGFLDAECHLAFYKAGLGAWNQSTNPIIGARCDVVMINGRKLATGQQDLAYDFKIEVGNTVKTQAKFAGTNYNINLTGATGATTLGFTAGPGLITVELGSGTFATSNGAVDPNVGDNGKAIAQITGGSGTCGLHLGTTSAASVGARQAQTFSGSSPLASGAWKKMGVFHANMTKSDVITTWWGTEQKVNAILPLSYLKASKMVLNFSAVESSIPTAWLPLNGYPTQGFHPWGTNVAQGFLAAQHGIDESAAGDADHIGVYPTGECRDLIMWGNATQHAGARRGMKDYARVEFFKTFNFRDDGDATGCVMPLDEGSIYSFGQPGGYSPIVIPANSSQGYIQHFANNHTGSTCYLPYLLLGKLAYLQELCTGMFNYNLIGAPNQHYGYQSTYPITNQTVITFRTSLDYKPGFGQAAVEDAGLATGFPFETGEAVKLDFYSAPTVNGAALARANIFYWRKLSPTTGSLYDTRAHAIAGGSTGLATINSAAYGVWPYNGTGKFSGFDADNNARAQAWNTRSWSQPVAVIGDAIADGIVGHNWNKAELQRALNLIGLYHKRKYVDDTSWVANGPRWTLDSGNVPDGSHLFGPWHRTYIGIAQRGADDMGVFDTNFRNFAVWLHSHFLNSTKASNGIWPDACQGNIYYERVTDTNLSEADKTWAGFYKKCCGARSGEIMPSGASYGSLTGSISSVADPANVAVTLSASFFDPAATAPHIGAWIDIGTGCGQIKSISSSTNFVIDCTVSGYRGGARDSDQFTSSGTSFGVTPLTGSNLFIGRFTFRPATYSGHLDYQVPTVFDRFYNTMARSCCLASAKDFGLGVAADYTAAAALYAAMNMPAQPPAGADIIQSVSQLKFNIIPRT